MTEDYHGLGLTNKDIATLKKHGLSRILHKIKEQHHTLELQKEHLESALNNIEKNLNAAREAQMSLLPKDLLGIPDVEFSARFYPSQYVSGDIYNVFRLDESNFGVYHIDVSGHGVASALFSVSLSQMLNTTVTKQNILKIATPDPPYYKISSPDKVIATLDEDRSFERHGMYFTMIYMIVNVKTKKVKFTRAGHNYPIVIRADKSIEIFKAGSIPIGWDLPRNDEVVELDVQSGDRIFLYSDGIHEATNPERKMFTLKRLCDSLKNSSNLSLDDSLDNLISELRQFIGQDNFEDDVSILSISMK
ncbi:MAG: PP2C family protein-serine/threonine phosphatase [Calditrichaceae bacterium]|jgi:sigma-B regulation protein RsbU (phosphoserine phosphatase)